MRFTISGFWTAMVVVTLMTFLLYCITRSSRVYKVINPNIIIVFTMLVILRVVLPFESVNARGIFVLKAVPEMDTAIRYPVFTIGGKAITTWIILSLIWAGVGTVKVYIMIRQYFAMSKSLNLCKPLNKEKISVVRAAEKEMKISGHITYKVSSIYTSPFIFGIFQPIIVLPAAIVNFTDKEIYMMMYHELSHYKRKDCITKVLLELFACVFWWLPFMKSLMEKLDEAVEVRADWNTIKKMSEAEKTEYLVALYHVSEIVGKQKNEVQYANMFTSGQINSIEKRFRFIADYKKWHMTSVLMIMALTVFVISYMIVIEPYHLPGDGSIGCKNICTVYEQKNGEYAIYMDGEFSGTAKNLEFLNDKNFANIEVNIMEAEYE